MIACLGWGSLVWDPRDLALRQPTSWQDDGPLLPVEFARKSMNGRITLVLLSEGAAVRTLWAEMAPASLDDARSSLATREDCNVNAIGYWPSGSEKFEHAETIEVWARAKRLEGVIWTALGPKFRHAGEVASADEISGYLSSLSGETRALAEEYVRKTPIQVRTPYRAAIERELGWTPL